MNITIRQMEAFLAVAETESFTRAAERIHVTQSAISVLIRELEQQLQVRLFDRNTRSVNLTEAGRAFFPFVEKSLAELETAIRSTRELREKKRGRLIVAGPPLIASTLLPGVIGDFQKVYPGVTVILRDMLADDIALRVRTGEVDLGIGTFHLSDPGLLITVKATDRLVIMCPRKHPLAVKRKVRWIDLDRHSSLRQIVDRTIEPVNRDIALITAHGKSLSPAAEAFVEVLTRSLRQQKRQQT